MRKFMNIFLILMLSFFLNALDTIAKTIYEVSVPFSSVALRTGPGTNYATIMTIPTDKVYSLVQKDPVSSESGCSSGWYKVYYQTNSIGYFCAAFGEVITKEEEEFVLSEECQNKLKDFPDSYKEPLCKLIQKYPNWTFIADKTGISFADAVSYESVVGKSLIQTKNEGYLSTASNAYNYLTDTFVIKEGTNWYAASPDTVAYYLDPRNFLDETGIFMFEKLSFDAEYQTPDAISAILSGRDICEKTNVIYNAAKDTGANAIYLASKIRQETGGSYSGMSLKGASITVNNVYYEHIYNPYNIGANSGAYDGLVWAAKGTTYLRPWTTLDTAIKGGSLFITNDYISKGQDTVYFQKFNVSSYTSANKYTHQYMTNVKGASDEGKISYNGYKDEDLLQGTAFKFIIPVYENMKDYYNLPDTGNPNNHLKGISINGTALNGFSHDIYEYNYYVSADEVSVKIAADKINANATVDGIGTINLNGEKTKAVIKVTAQNKKVQEYVINFIRTEGVKLSVNDIISSVGLSTSDEFMIFNAGVSVQNLNSMIQKKSASAKVTVEGKKEGILATNDKVTIQNGEDQKSFTLVVKGDPNGDGNINIQDLLRIQKYILGYSSLEGDFYKAADTNQDGVVNVVDLLRIQKHILGYITIS